MASEIMNYQCPACGGPLKFLDGSLKCEYCESVFSVSEMEKARAEDLAQAAEQKRETEAIETADAFSQEEAGHLRAYNCPSCGAQLICDENTAATSCPYCGNPTVVPGNLSGALKPDYIIPFRLDKKAAVEALTRFYSGKKLLPPNFQEKNHIEEIQGVYVPFWLYDCSMMGEAQYQAQKVRSWRQGEYRVTETSFFRVARAGRMQFERIPVDASSKMPDTHMDAIEPYDYKDLVPFATSYLPGYLADRYDVEAKDAAVRAQERAQQSLERALHETVAEYDAATPTGSRFRVERQQVKYALMPVWLLSTKWNDQNFLFAMNGQTGKLIGDLPVSGKKYWGWFLKIFLPLAIIILVIWFGFMK